MKNFLLILLFALVTLSNSDEISSVLDESQKIKLLDLEDKIKKIDQQIGAKNIWIKRFYDHKEYLNLQSQLQDINNKITVTARKKTKAAQKELEDLEAKSQTLKSKLALTEDIGSSGVEGLAKIDPIIDPPEIKNPIAIIGGLSYIKENQKLLDEYKNRLKDLKKTTDLVYEKYSYMEQRLELLSIEDRAGAIKDAELLKESYQISTLLNNAYELFSIALMVQEKKFNTSSQLIENSIKKEIIKLINIAISVAVVIAIGFLARFIAFRTVQDATRFFGIRRTINITLFFIITLILLFNYISNIVYFVTLLGFISAGIAIAMKDWFMSLLGWLVMGVTGSIKVGDRIRVVYNNETILGDVLEIGLIKIKLFVDVSLTTLEETRRAGQVIYFPNSLIFTQVIQNYTYSKLKTIWDGIDIVITFDSNHTKAQKIAREIATKHTSGFMNITRKHYAFLRERFNLRTINHEPRVFALVDRYGIKISIWYLASSYGTLSLRSLISTELIDAFNAEEDIKIAYPTYAIGTNGDSFAPVDPATPYPS